MTTHQAHMLSLWLRDQGYNAEQIASVLSIEPHQVSPFLRRAMTVVRTAGRPSCGIAVVATSPDHVIDHAAELARGCDGLLHVIDTYKAIRRTGFALSERKMRDGGAAGREADEHLLRASRRALLSRVDVAPHAFPADIRTAMERLNTTWGPVTLVLGSSDTTSGPLAKAARRAHITVVLLDDAGQVASPRRGVSRQLRSALIAASRPSTPTTRMSVFGT